MLSCHNNQKVQVCSLTYIPLYEITWSLITIRYSKTFLTSFVICNVRYAYTVLLRVSACIPLLILNTNCSYFLTNIFSQIIGKVFRPFLEDLSTVLTLYAAHFSLAFFLLLLKFMLIPWETLINYCPV